MFLRDRLFRSNGMCMYSLSRMTEGVGIENRDECNHVLELSSARATPLSTRTTARRAVQTLMGSNDALRTKTRKFIQNGNIAGTRRACQKCRKRFGQPCTARRL